MKRIDKQDLVLGLSVVALALVILFGLMPWAVKVPKVVPNLALSPTFWPRIILVALAGLGALLALRTVCQGLLQPDGTAESQGNAELDVEQAGSHGDTNPFDSSDLRVLTAAGMTIVFVSLLKPLGIIVPAATMLFAMVLLHERRKWQAGLVLSVVTVGVLYVFFRHVAQIPIPLGILNPLF